MRGRTTAAVGRSGDVVNPYRSNLNNNNNYYYYYNINPCVFDASLRVLLSVPHHCNERRPSAHSSCRPPRRRSLTPPIVTSCSALQDTLRCQSRCSAECTHRARHIRAATTGFYCRGHPASLLPPRSAQPRKRTDCRGHEAQLRGRGGGGGNTYPP